MALWSNGATRSQAPGWRSQATARHGPPAAAGAGALYRADGPKSTIRVRAMEPVMARKMWRTLEPYHGLIYFAPEATAAYEALGVMGFDGYFASRAAADGRRARRGGGGHLLQLQPRHRPPRHPRRMGASTTPEALLEARLNAASDALRRAARRPPRRLRRCARAAELARRRRGRRARPRGVRSTPGTRPCRGPTSRRSRSGTPSRCCGSSAATATSPASSRRASTGSTRSVFHAASGEVPRAALQGSRQWDDAVVGRVGGEPRRPGLRRRRRRLHRGRRRPPPADRGPHRRPRPRSVAGPR